MKNRTPVKDDPRALISRYEVLFLLIHAVIALPTVRHFLTEPRSFVLGITSLLFVVGLWLMREVVTTTREEFVGNFEESDNGLAGIWVHLAFYLGAPIVGAIIGGFGLVSLITGTIHLVRGTPLMDIGLSDWIVGPCLLASVGVAALMWGTHLQPKQAKARAVAKASSSQQRGRGRFRSALIEIVIAIQANRFFFLLIDSLPKSGSEEWVMNAILLALVSTVFFLPLQLLVWRLRNRPISRWDLWKMLLLFSFVSLTHHLAPDGWLSVIRGWF